MAVYGLYVLSIPSLAVFALIGVILAIMARDEAGPLARSHLNDQIRVWIVAFWWALGLGLLWLVGLITSIILIGIPIMWLAALGAFIVGVWFTIKSILGFLALMDGRPR